MDTIREQVVKAIIARLQPLTANPVLRREQYDDEDEFINVWDGEHTSEKVQFGRTRYTMTVTIEFIKSDAARPYAEAANAMYGDIIQAIFQDGGQPEPTLGGLAESMTETSALTLTPDAGLKVIGGAVSIDVIFETLNGDPFSQ